MKNIILTLLTVLTLCLGSSYSQSKSDTLNSWTSEDVQLMADLIPLLYKDVLRYDSCKEDAKVLDSMNVSLSNIIESYRISAVMQDSIASKLNQMLDQKNLQISIRDKKIKIVRKKAFWRGFKWGSGVTGTIILVVIVILL